MYVCMYVCMYAHHTDIHAPHQKASVATQPSFRHHSFGRVLHKLWLALLPATQASLSLHCAERSHRHLLSTHNASEPCPFALPQGLGVIAQRHRRPFAHCPPSTQASQPSKPVPSPSTALSEPTGACSRFRRTPSPARRIAKGAWRESPALAKTPPARRCIRLHDGRGSGYGEHVLLVHDGFGGEHGTAGPVKGGCEVDHEEQRAQVTANC